LGYGNFSGSGDGSVIFKLYHGFAFVAIASGIVTLVRIALGEDAIEAARPNVVIGSVCFAVMGLLLYRERRKINAKT